MSTQASSIPAALPARHRVRGFAAGLACALAGVALVEVLLGAGLKPFSPIGWPGLGMLAAAAFFAFEGLAGGALVVVAYYALSFGSARFAPFFEAALPSVAWFSALTVVGVAAALMRTRLRRAESHWAFERSLRESEDWLKNITDNIPGLVAYIDADERYRFANVAYEAWIGMRPEKMRGRTVRELWGEERYALFQPNLQRALSGERITYEYSVTYDSRERRMLATYAPDKDAAGRIRGVFVLSSDVTDLVRARNEARDAQARLESALDGSSVALWDADLRNNRVYLSDAWGEIVGEERGDMVSSVEDLGALVHPEDLEATRRAQLETMKGAQPLYVMEHRVRAGKDGWRWILSRGRVTERDPSGKALRMVGTNVDITDRKRMEEALQSVASTDALTGLANRVALADRIRLAVARSRRNASAFALLYLDLDHFKQVNDSMGHSAGDKLLVHFAMRLRGCVRASDSVARLGGDEFVVLVEDIKDRDGALRIAEKILQDTRTPVRIDAREVAVTTSVGIAYHAEGESGEELLARADGALYRAKRLGRDAYCVA